MSSTQICWCRWGHPGTKKDLFGPGLAPKWPLKLVRASYRRLCDKGDNRPWKEEEQVEEEKAEEEEGEEAPGDHGGGGEHG